VPIYGGPAYNQNTRTGCESPDPPFAPGATAGNGRNWVSGVCRFDPDGAGPLLRDGSTFLSNASSIVPESALI